MMGWPDFLQAQSQQPYFRDLQSQLQAARAQGQLVYPPEAMIFRAFDLTPFDAVRVVILGQDPYHGAGQAHGLAFSVPHGQAVPPSLKNIYKALQHDFADFQPPQHGCLEAWAQQGVLLLNTVLTVQAGQAHSHASWGWETLSDAAISALSAQRQGLVFMLWGAHALKRDPQTKPLLDAAHSVPSSKRRWS